MPQARFSRIPLPTEEARTNSWRRGWFAVGRRFEVSLLPANSVLERRATKSRSSGVPFFCKNSWAADEIRLKDFWAFVRFLTDKH
jgi:hypothetical protein